ncbi:MAG: FadR family transcriptional regulator [Spirochaetales bacterium]|nr:FadR family transcriptional regulator [Spirochaetales bacterium]
MQNLKEVHKTTLVEQVMTSIKKLIASDTYKPGDKIPTEQELAESLDVGRSSIREAIKIFNYLGVLKSIAGKGTFIQERSKISTEALTWSMLLGNDEFEEMVDLRGSLEVGATFTISALMKADKNFADQILEKLEENIALMKKSIKENDRDNLIELDLRFHRIIIQECRNELVISLFDTLKSFLYDEIRQSQRDYINLSKIADEHEDLLKALKSGNPANLQSAFSEHYENIKNRIKNPQQKG